MDIKEHGYLSNNLATKLNEDRSIKQLAALKGLQIIDIIQQVSASALMHFVPTSV